MSTDVARITHELGALVVPIDSLHPHPDNPRVGDVDAIAASLERYGLLRPILAMPDGTIIAGNHTWKAAKQLGWTEIAAAPFHGTPLEARAYMLADNALADRGHYDNRLLIENLEALAGELGDALEAATGYTMQAVDELLAGLGDAFIEGSADDEGEDDRGTLLALSDVTTGEPIHEVEHGDVWRLGGVESGHVLIVADLFTDHHLWGPWLGRATVNAAETQAEVLFVPYPTPHMPFSTDIQGKRLVMVAPDKYLCGKLLDAWAAVEGEDRITKAASR